MHEGLKRVILAAKEKLRSHFRDRQAELEANIIEQWKEEKIYPYQGEPANIVERTERQVFDLFVLSLNTNLRSFAESDLSNKRLLFHLIREALGSSPDALHKIFREILSLSEDQQKEFAEILDKTSLSAIIRLSKLVANRLDCLQGIKTLLHEYKNTLKERSQLHRLVSENTWLFGEEFAVVVDDQSLTEVLNAHLASIRTDENDQEEEGTVAADHVYKPDGSRGIIDLMVSKRVPYPDKMQREHLVIELKRPSVKIGGKQISQIEDYATAVARDKRFYSRNHYCPVKSQITSTGYKMHLSRFAESFP